MLRRILRQSPPLMNEDALPMLKEKGLKKYTEVWTSDDERLGIALRFHHRPESEVDPVLKLYGVYLHVQSIPFAGPVYVPTEFIADYDPDANRLTLSADKDYVADEVWNRMPDFVAAGRGYEEELPE